MNFPAAVSSSIQVFAAFAIFVAGYLALVIAAIVFLVIAELYSDRARFVQAYATKSSSLECSGMSGASRKIIAAPRRVSLLVRR
jgi:hypothetical protein